MIETGQEIAPEPNADVACPAGHECARSLCIKPAKRGQVHGAFCSDYCRKWIRRHPWDDRRKKKKCLVTRSTQKPELRRLKRSCQAILGRLMQGPATMWDLIKCGGGTRVGARVHELKRIYEPGHDIRLIARDVETGATTYALFVHDVMVKP